MGDSTIPLYIYIHSLPKARKGKLGGPIVPMVKAAASDMVEAKTPSGQKEEAPLNSSWEKGAREKLANCKLRGNCLPGKRADVLPN